MIAGGNSERLISGEVHFSNYKFKLFGYRPGKYDRTLQALSAVDCNSCQFGSSILTEHFAAEYGNLRIFGGLS